ncbi:hypothetical protein GGR57DRAFT_74462 [Xylariaceae sp. FL1272]|nr:hypothetical protein GGR57DRAFT_74462 [Xylariaceae sp. FL1272]
MSTCQKVTTLVISLSRILSLYYTIHILPLLDKPHLLASHTSSFSQILTLFRLSYKIYLTLYSTLQMHIYLPIANAYFSKDLSTPLLQTHNNQSKPGHVHNLIVHFPEAHRTTLALQFVDTFQTQEVKAITQSRFR